MNSFEDASTSLESDSIIGKLVRKTWPMLLCTSILSLIGGYFWATQFSTSTYEVESRLVFNRSAIGGPLYQSPDVHTLVAEFTAVESLEKLREEYGLNVPNDVLLKRVKSVVRRGNGAIDFSLAWENQEDAERLLNSLVSIGNERARSIRNDGLDGYVSSLRLLLDERYLPAVADIQQQYDSLSNKYGVSDLLEAHGELSGEIRKLKETIRDEEFQLEANTEYRAKYDAKKETLVSVQPAKSQTNSESNSDSIAVSHASLSSTELLRRITRIKSEINEERSRAVAKSKLQSKEIELQRIKRLADQQLVPSSRYEALLAEVKQLRLVVDGTPSVNALESELDGLATSLKQSEQLDGPIEEVEEEEREIAQIDQRLAESRIRVRQLTRLLDAREPKLERLEVELDRAEEFQNQLEIAAKRAENQKQIADNLDNMKSTDAHLFTVLSPAQPSLNPETSNFRKQFAGAFIVSLLALSCPGLILSLRKVLPAPGEALAKRLGVGELGKVVRGSVSESYRLIAVRLAREVDAGLIQFVGLGSQKENVLASHSIGQALASMRQNVVLVVVGDTAGDLSTNQDSLDVISGVAPDDVFSKVDLLRADGSLVLVSGQELSRVADIEQLGLQADAVVLNAAGGKQIAEESQDVAINMARFNAPILGVIS